ncbi:hypothetical protein EJM73_08585 [Clostridium botulinum]|uniref:hypothetical protein n=1 Tax=Clostridium botulinum TaxID=1491 RepID=UPI001376396A|nr:hypothetical protein [Clostridium botulinum]NCI19680.1 hypothetical protein [Clostridium botulinum]NCI35718.1 hypothetical protein [Clostridium botulinum]NCI71575.1 hypothetical protein [Clostridium botulinum]NDI38767.1 hypothetical protein [Clostridium botulinum]
MIPEEKIRIPLDETFLLESQIEKLKQENQALKAQLFTYKEAVRIFETNSNKDEYEYKELKDRLNKTIQVVKHLSSLI